MKTIASAIINKRTPPAITGQDIWTDEEETGAGVGVDSTSFAPTRTWSALDAFNSARASHRPFWRKMKAVTCQDSSSVKLPGFQKGMAAAINACKTAALGNF